MKTTTLALALLFTLGVAAQNPNRKQTEDNLHGPGSQPFDGFRVIGNIYYVGAVSISSYIITTPDGLIMLDTGTEQMAPVVANNVEKLGFHLKDVKILLNSHAHFDHVEGHAAMKALTGAKVMAMAEDVDALERGVDTSTGGYVGWKPVKVDRVLKDGDTVAFGGMTLQAHHTPGHTKGATAWTTTVQDAGKPLRVVFLGGTGVNAGTKLLGNTVHPTIVTDFAKTFRVLKTLNAEVFLAPHANQFGLVDKLKRLKAGESPNPFIDPEGYKRFVDQEEGKYLTLLHGEQVARQ